MARNLTISLPDDLARRVRVRAAEKDTSVSKYVCQLLEREFGSTADATVGDSAGLPRADRPPEYWEAYEKWKELVPITGIQAADRLSREEIYDRK